ncbi:MAG TPA: acyl-CoA synthetase FdrA [Tissierellaceae bacterium]|nr:acyl-CoA synthetase FdrA [Tissierellaceae bacterium]
MLKTIINKDTYQDSVVLMLLTNEISELEGVNKVSIMMATPANKDIFDSSGLRTPELEEATANDMAIVVDAENDEVIDTVLEEVDRFLSEQSKGTSGEKIEKTIKSWEAALKELPDTNLAVVSVPGVYAASVANRALDEDLNVFIFSDNVEVEDELKIKEKAREKGLLCMGPDSGTGVINSVPIAFTNDIKEGKIGIVGASGTGIQEVSTIIDKLGEGVTNAIGTGGRDLSEKVGGITMLSGIATLAEDDDTDVITIISKPPAESVRNKIMNYLRTLDKPVVTIFLGEKPEYHEENLYHAYTLEEAARISVALARGEEVENFKGDTSIEIEDSKDGKTIKGYYSGGTLGGEAAMLINDALDNDKGIENVEGFLFKEDGFEIIDLGDDEYTQGTPHPMIDPTNRAEHMKKAMEDESTSVILFDLVLGYGSHDDMASALAPSIESLREQAEKENREVHFVTTICGTERDPQGYEQQKQIMEDAGVIVCQTNNAAVEKALALIGKSVNYPDKEIKSKENITEKVEVEVSENMKDLINSEPRIINIGLESFAETLDSFPCEVVQYNWKPIAGGDVELINVLDFLRSYEY